MKVVVALVLVVVVVEVEQPLTTAVRSQSSSIERDKACESVPCLCSASAFAYHCLRTKKERDKGGR